MLMTYGVESLSFAMDYGRQITVPNAPTAKDDLLRLFGGETHSGIFRTRDGGVTAILGNPNTVISVNPVGDSEIGDAKPSLVGRRVLALQAYRAAMVDANKTEDRAHTGLDLWSDTANDRLPGNFVTKATSLRFIPQAPDGHCRIEVGAKNFPDALDTAVHGLWMCLPLSSANGSKQAIQDLVAREVVGTDEWASIASAWEQSEDEASITGDPVVAAEVILQSLPQTVVTVS